MSQQVPQIFMSYARQDQERVLPFYEWLKEQGFNVWMDVRQLRPGQNWDFEIRRALDRSSFVIAFISRNSFDKRGYVQLELKLALNKLSEKLIGDIYLIPVFLDDNLPIPEQLRAIQAIYLSDSKCLENIASALNHQLESAGIELQRTQEQADIYWSTQIRKEFWDGLPGYEVTLQFLHFNSERYQNLSDISEYIRGTLISNLFEYRMNKLEQSPEIFNFGQDRFMRTNALDVLYRDISIVGKLISVIYIVQWYGAGAAHTNYYFRTHSFMLDPLFVINTIDELFVDKEKAFIVVRDLLRDQLSKLVFNDNEKEEKLLDEKWILTGTESWDNFSAFVFRPNGIEIIFAPYQVGAYALGAQVAIIPYNSIAALMRTEYKSALRIDFIEAQLEEPSQTDSQLASTEE